MTKTWTVVGDTIEVTDTNISTYILCRDDIDDKVDGIMNEIKMCEQELTRLDDQVGWEKDRIKSLEKEIKEYERMLKELGK